jgi:cytochrome c-type biogenesis protein CcmH
MADWLFWGIAAALALGSLGLVFAPLLRGAGAGERRASYDMQVFRDQLREVEADRARGVLSEAEAAATRIEVSRRLLATAEAEAAEVAAAAAPRRLSRWAAPAAMAGLVAGAAWLYLALGAPGMPDDPLKVRMARDAAERANRPSQAEVEAMVAARGEAPPTQATPEDEALIAQLQVVLEARPDDVQGHRLLARSLAALGRWPEARAAQERVLELLGDAATAQDLVDAGELRILAADGYVSPEAEAALARALALEPGNPVGRYYSGLTLIQGGRPDLAYRVWSGLLDEGPPDAPWIAPIAAGIDEVARMAGLPPRTPAPGPSAADVDAAGEMAPAERQAMIEGMVARLSDRLATQGGPPADWAQLIRSLGVLGRRDEAAAILGEARAKHAGDPAALAEFTAAARDAGLAP